MNHAWPSQYVARQKTMSRPCTVREIRVEHCLNVKRCLVAVTQKLQNKIGKLHFCRTGFWFFFFFRVLFLLDVLH